VGARGKHADFLEAVHKILARAPPRSPEHPWLDKLKSMFG
jgi:hypothetical protein